MARFVLHHAPGSRSFRILWLLEELGVSYDLVLHDLSAGTQKDPAFLALNSFGKVPVLQDRGPDGQWPDSVVTESAAICLYLADLLPEASLAPSIPSRMRAAYDSWMFFCPAVLEPAFADLVFPRAEAAPARALGWPEFAAAAAHVENQLARRGPWLLGETFSAADILVSPMLNWAVQWRKHTAGPATERWLAALEARPARTRAQQRESEASQGHASGQPPAHAQDRSA